MAGTELSSPAWSPNGQSLAWVSHEENVSTHPTYPKITVFDLNSRKKRELSLPFGMGADGDLRWLPSGRELLLLFSRMYQGVRDPGSQIGSLSIITGDFRQLTNDMIDHSELALSGDGTTIATLLQQSGSEIGFYDSSGSTVISSARLPIVAQNVIWLDDNRLLTFLPWFGTVRRDNGEFANFDLITPESVHETRFEKYDSFNTAPVVCPDGKIIISGALNSVDQLFMVDSHGQFVKTLIKLKDVGNAYCNNQNKLLYTGGDSSEPSIWSLSLSGDSPYKLMSLPDNAPMVYSSDGRFAGYVANDGGRSTATIIDIQQRKVVYSLPLTYYAQATLPHFTPDGRALAFVEQQETGYALALQPIDGSSPRLLTTWFKDPITDFGWSPSGKILAIMREHSTSDVALISDKSAKSPWRK